MDTIELSGENLDWAVAKAEGWTITRCGMPCNCLQYRNPAGLCDRLPLYSSDWSKGGPIIEREKISLENRDHGGIPPSRWFASRAGSADKSTVVGSTPLVAAMRLYAQCSRMNAD